MNRKLVVLVTAVGMSLGWAGSSAAQYLSGSARGEFRTFLGRLEYDPSRPCIKPARPFADDAYARNMHVSRAREYLRCLGSAADQDLDYARAVILAGRQKAVDDYLEEVRRGY